MRGAVATFSKPQRHDSQDSPKIGCYSPYTMQSTRVRSKHKQCLQRLPTGVPRKKHLALIQSWGDLSPEVVIHEPMLMWLYSQQLSFCVLMSMTKEKTLRHSPSQLTQQSHTKTDRPTLFKQSSKQYTWIRQSLFAATKHHNAVFSDGTTKYPLLVKRTVDKHCLRLSIPVLNFSTS